MENTVSKKRIALGWNIKRLAFESELMDEKLVEDIEQGKTENSELRGKLEKALDAAIAKQLPLLMEIVEAQSPESKKVSWSGVARLIRERREAARLSRRQLGKLISYSDSLIKFVESNKVTPTRSFLMGLTKVPALGLVWEDFGSIVGATPLIRSDAAQSAPCESPDTQAHSAGGEGNPAASVTTDRGSAGIPEEDEEITIVIKRRRYRTSPMGNAPEHIERSPVCSGGSPVP